jgi:hypothetical protein
MEAAGTTNEGQTKIDDMKAIATVLVIIYAVIGGALVILSASLDHIDAALKLSYKDYLEQMAIAAGALSIGRGIVANAKAKAGG